MSAQRDFFEACAIAADRWDDRESRATSGYRNLVGNRVTGGPRQRSRHRDALGARGSRSSTRTTRRSRPGSLSCWASSACSRSPAFSAVFGACCAPPKAPRPCRRSSSPWGGAAFVALGMVSHIFIEGVGVTMHFTSSAARPCAVDRPWCWTVLVDESATLTDSARPDCRRFQTLARRAMGRMTLLHRLALTEQQAELLRPRKNIPSADRKDAKNGSESGSCTREPPFKSGVRVPRWS